MIDIKISETVYPVPTSWNDVTFLKYCDIVKCHEEHFIKRLSVYSGIEIETLNKLTYQGILELAAAVQFMDTPDDIDGFAIGYESELNIGHESYEKLEASKQAIQKNPDLPLKAAIEVIKFYTEEDISNKPITQAIGQAVFFLMQLENSWTNSKGLMNTNPTPMNWRQVLRNLQLLAVGGQPCPTPVEQT